MIGLITMLASTMGAAGMGSCLKIVAGIIDRFGAAREAKEKRKLAALFKTKTLDNEQYNAIFNSDTEASAFTRGTRRAIAIIGMLNFFVLSVLGMVWPSVPLVTWILPEHKEKFSIAWGLIEIPIGGATTAVLTTGHVAVAALTTLSAIIGFYFTPAGRK